MLNSLRSKIILAFVVAGMLGAGMIALFYTGNIRANYPSSKTYPIQGIDVSHHQGKIEWEKVSQEEIQFAFIKATEGGDFKDKRFTENWNAAKAVGIEVGAYHFFTFCKSGRTQAANFISSVPTENSALPPVIDLEYGGNCKLVKPIESVLAELDTLIGILDAQYGKRPILYVTNQFYTDFIIGKYLDNPIWIRDIYQAPTLSDTRTWTFWQFANRGHVNGITGYVDLNVFNGSVEAYSRFKNGIEMQ